VLTLTPIETNFLREARKKHAKLLQPNGLFDATRILEVFPDAMTQLRNQPLADLSDYAEQTFHLEAGPDVVLPRPRHSDSYIFKHNVLQSPPVPYFVLEDVYFSFDIRNNGAPEFYVFNKDKELINGLFFGAKPFVNDPLKMIEEPSVLIDDFFVSPNICHFIFDKFPRWHIASELTGPLRPVMFHPFSYVEDIFSLLGTKHLFLIDPPIRMGTVFFKSLVVFGNSINGLRHPLNNGHSLWRQALQTLQGEVPKAQSHSRTRLMLTRAPGLPRQIQNMSEVTKLLAEYNVKLVDPANFSPLEQLQIFSNCSLLIGAHGAGLTNLAFTPPGSKIIELLPPLCATQAYWTIAHFLGYSYEAITCIDPEHGIVDQSNVEHNPRNNRRDIIVPLETLKTLLDQT
jgi:hypothetical protein